MIVLTLPFPPTINHCYGQRKFGGKYLKPAGVLFKQMVADLVADEGAKTLTGRVSLFAVAYMPDKRKRDLDNLLKLLQDALTSAGVYEDDSQIDDLHISRHYEVVKGGQVKVIVREIDDGERKTK